MDKECICSKLNDIDRDKLMKALAEELPVLRAKLGISQGDLSNCIGVSRQTYSAIETKKKDMSWNTFLSLMFFFEHNEKTRKMLLDMEEFPADLQELLSINKNGE